MLTIKLFELLKRNSVRQYFQPLSFQDQETFREIRNNLAHEYEDPLYRPEAHYRWLLKHLPQLLTPLRGCLNDLVARAQDSVAYEITHWDQKFRRNARKEEKKRRQKFRDDQDGEPCTCPPAPDDGFVPCNCRILLEYNSDDEVSLSEVSRHGTEDESNLKTYGRRILQRICGIFTCFGRDSDYSRM
jgi:hypothetical protein